MRLSSPAISLICAGLLALVQAAPAAAQPEADFVPRPRPDAPAAAALPEASPPSAGAPLEPVESVEDVPADTAGAPPPSDDLAAAPPPRPRPQPSGSAPSGSIAGLPAADPAQPAALAPGAPPGSVSSIAGLPAPDVELPEPVPERPDPTSAVAALDLFARAPRSRPAGDPKSLLALLEPGPEEGRAEAPLAPPIPVLGSATHAACLQRLDSLGVTFTKLAPLDPGGVCEVAAPIQVTSFGSGVTVSASTMNCRTAEAVALWVRDVLVPSSKAHLGAMPTGLLPGSTYDCRPRNRQAGAKLSEHGRGNAFDVMGVEFAGREPMEIRARNTAEPEGRFQAAIRERSCAYFTTVLGPGSDAAHFNHLHFDLAERRGGYRLCSLGETRTVRASGKTKRE